MHGHQGMSKIDVRELLFQHGNPSMYNVILEGHLHSRIVKKAMRAKQVKSVNEVVVEMDRANFRKITVPPMFTGNFYSTALGYSSSAGLTLIERSGAGINHHDLQI